MVAGSRVFASAFEPHGNLPAVSKAAMTTGRTATVWMCVILIVLNVALPKGGIRLGALPLTWGYVAVFLSIIPAGLGMLRRGAPSVAPILHVCVFFLPVSLLIALKAYAYDVPIASVAVYQTLFFLLPVSLLIFVGPYLEDVPADVIGQALTWSIRFVVFWGLLNFVLYPVIKDIIQIPYVTINAADLGDIFSRNNRRGALMKLISTYNNGNLFGDCMVMLAPVYLLFERSRIWAAFFIAALVCTLSRTVWLGLIAVSGLMVLSGQIEVRRTRVWLGGAVAVALFVAILPFMGWTTDSFVDNAATLGGRDRLFSAFELSFFGRVTVTIPEIIYFGFLNSFGVVGFVFAVGALAAGPVFGALNWTRLSPLRRSAVVGAAAYMLMALADGGFVFPPVFLQFLFLTCLIYRRGLREDSVSAPLRQNAITAARRRTERDDLAHGAA